MANTISNTGKFVKIVHRDFFGEDGGKNPHYSDPKTDDCDTVASDKDACDCAIRMENHPLYALSYPQPFIITSIAY